MKILCIICGFMNSSEMGSGGGIRMIETVKRISKYNVISFLTSTGGKKLLKNIFPLSSILGLRSYLFRCRPNKKGSYFDIVFSYAILVFHSFFKISQLPRADLIYTSGDGFWNVIPAFLYKKRYPKAKWIAISYHKVLLRQETIQSFIVSLVNIIFQRFSYFFIAITIKYP